MGDPARNALDRIAPWATGNRGRHASAGRSAEARQRCNMAATGSPLSPCVAYPQIGSGHRGLTGTRTAARYGRTGPAQSSAHRDPSPTVGSPKSLRSAGDPGHARFITVEVCRRDRHWRPGPAAAHICHGHAASLGHPVCQPSAQGRTLAIHLFGFASGNRQLKPSMGMVTFSTSAPQSNSSIG